MIRYFLFFIALAAMPWKVYPGNTDNWNFKVYLDDKPVGFHNFTVVDGDSNEKKLKSVAQFDVDVFIFNAYSYQHESNERWQGDCLTEINASTNDNGEKLSVQGKTTQSNFDLVKPKGQSGLPSCVMTFAYWNPNMLTQKRLLNPQNGEYVDVEIKPIGQETVKVNGKSQPASHYRLKSDKFLIDLWYSPDNRWLALDSTLENGRILHYRME